eukprot:gnl/TRDRNA2_/TRDRNA2_159373_c1_seq2.p1 gnl/TRDRNA2_/TRDRNA2_159373_c1~~gnl/TRDRNA2_/TRDRNA2_159373_c1_seq2.p1  ORF type:complete len:205 (+),score=35.93 gnl/TRDRNA2_/TRDRNA2_159373_c1_seq2:51-665(+)
MDSLDCTQEFLAEDVSRGVRSLVLENLKLRQRLGLTRARSQERLNVARKEHGELSAANTQLQNECRSLRELFVRQQRQQIALWSGPFLEMVCAPQPYSEDDLHSGTQSPRSADLARSNWSRGLRKERDYWRAMASELQEKLDKSMLDKSMSPQSAERESIKGAQEESASISTSQYGSELSRAMLSDSGSELSSSWATISRVVDT